MKNEIDGVKRKGCLLRKIDRAGTCYEITREYNDPAFPVLLYKIEKNIRSESGAFPDINSARIAAHIGGRS